jgi:hypothetical protein
MMKTVDTEVCAKFEAWFRVTFEGEPDYAHSFDQFMATTWSACAKLYREKLEDLQRQHDDVKMRLDELLKSENERLRADAARLDYIQSNARCDPKIDGNHVWWPTTFNHRLMGNTLRAAIDAAMNR